MTQIVITGVDGSNPAQEAAATAARVANAFDATLYVISVFGPGQDKGGRDSDFDPSLAAERISADSAASLQLNFPTLKVVSRAVAGHKPAETLVKAAEELEASLIVVGNKRVKGLGRLLGSIASEVAAKAPCDIYIVHTHD
ncbi:universal stress protein [Nocardioides gilvus]|uniref:universal stress protein n=1 Tax=Nocardioides gilvus TaxID=1735589 RepID=UPI000D74C5AC|nr:universal stress protein [Nocardioides gilvus]